MSTHGLHVHVSHFNYLKSDTPTFISLSLWPELPDLNPQNCKICVEMQQQVYLKSLQCEWTDIMALLAMPCAMHRRMQLNVCSCQNRTFWIFSLTVDYACVHFHVLVLWKLQVMWFYYVIYLKISLYLIFHISQDSAAAYVRCCGKHDKSIIAISLPNPTGKECWKSASVWQSYERIISLVFFDSECSQSVAYTEADT